MKELLEKKDLESLVLKSQKELVNYFLEEENEISTLKKQEQEISNKRKFKETRLEDMKSQLKEIFIKNNLEKITTESGTISLRQNPISVVVDNIDDVPAEYKIEKITVSVDKKKIAEHFKETGELIKGVSIETNNTSLQIK